MHYIWHHIHSLWYHTILWHSHTLYWCHHSQDTCHCIHSFWSLTYIILNIAHLQYLFSQTHYMYGIIWILCDITTALYDIVRWCIHDIISTLFMTSHPLYTSWHTLYLWHHSHCYYDKTPNMFLTLYSVYMTSQTVNEWQHNDCIWHDTYCICVIKPIRLMTSHHMYVWNHTHCIHETRDILCDITSPLSDNTPLFVCHGTQSVYEIICIIYVVTHIVCMTTKLYTWLVTR